MKSFLTPAVKKFLARLLIIAFTSVILTFFLEWRFFGNDFNKALDFLVSRPAVFFYNSLLLFFLELVISAPFKTPWTGAGLTFILVIIISYITTQKQIFRGQPLFPEDFMLADQTGTITKFIDMGSLIRTILACVLAFALMLLLNHLTKNFFKENSKKSLRIFRLMILIFGLTGFIISTDFIRNHSGEREQEIGFLNTTLVAWNQMQNYEDNGFLIGFMYNFAKFELKMPGGYNEQKIAEIKSKYSKETGKTSLKDADYNIVVVLNESFYDPEIIKDFYPITAKNVGSKNSMGNKITEDVVPNLRALIQNPAKNHATGKMYSIDYGGGTANIEFEVDASLSKFFVNIVPFVDLYPHVSQVPSISLLAKNASYKTSAIHPFNGGMYKRNSALKKEGIDEFITETEMTFAEKDEAREYINDRSAYKETLEKLRSTDEKAFISLITMQNHAGYNDGYQKPNYSLKNPENGTAFTEEERKLAEIYLESLHNSDAYLGEFLENLEKLDEKTVVLWYGDHAPGIFNRLIESTDKETNDLAHLTPYFIWANFDLTSVKPVENSANTERATSVDSLPTTTPNCLVPTLFSLLNLEKPAYLNLVSAVCAENPILDSTYFASSTPVNTETLKDYEFLIYDTLGGSQYWGE